MGPPYSENKYINFLWELLEACLDVIVPVICLGLILLFILWAICGIIIFFCGG